MSTNINDDKVPTNSADDYALGRNIMSRSRLNHQHFIFHKIFGYLLHSSIPVQKNTVIGDVATGTGIWLLDLMSTLEPSLRDTLSFRGFDIDLSQTPPKVWLPSNIDFSTFDITAPLPEGLFGKFDVINVRLLLFVVKDNDPSPILDKLYCMLKPGGWLQWTEADNTAEDYLDFVTSIQNFDSQSTNSKPGDAMRALYNKVTPRDSRFQPTWHLKLSRFFAASGFVDLQEDIRESTDFLPWLAFANDVTTPVYWEMIQRMPEGSAQRRESEEIYAEAAKESWEGTAWNSKRINVIGRKPTIETSKMS